jgi:hypothetical protein
MVRRRWEERKERSGSARETGRAREDMLAGAVGFGREEDDGSVPVLGSRPALVGGAGLVSSAGCGGAASGRNGKNGEGGGGGSAGALSSGNSGSCRVLRPPYHW